ncbi:MAG: hypothetical protein AB7O62_22475, partial [Pirellulales bacterium]
MNSRQHFSCFLLPMLMVACISLQTAYAAEPAKPKVAGPAKAKAVPPAKSSIKWHQDYSQAWNEAWKGGKMLFIYFQPTSLGSARANFESQSLAPSVLQPFAGKFVWLKIPANARQPGAKANQTLLSHTAFAEMHGQPGIAVIDLESRNTRLYGQVVSAFPFPSGTYYGPRHLSVILGLPHGTLTQRTMVYAVRVHPEAPASAWGTFSHNLAGQAESHSNHQASINLQGHHNWDSRFQMINATLPGGLLAQEVVAESWPGQDMLTAAHECVNSWRQSDGHWSAVRSRHGLFAFDIKRGGNGIWYGTGLFGKYR